tara:strand:- start:2943 stop:4118 length:1176 start_codon:yes stop_codon:yes gene_type:complete
MNKTLSSWPFYDQDEIDAALRVLSSGKVNYWTGNEGKAFENEFSSWVDVKHSISLANGTVALELALNAIDICPGDEIIVTPRTFIASISSVINSGAIPVFADVDKNTQNITAETILDVMTNNTKAIVCVHLGGYPCEMDEIMSLANSYNLYVIEDCAQAHGATYKGRHVGSIGHIGAWSFCQDKIISTGGEGGMVTTNDEDLWQKMWSYKDHGKSWEKVHSRNHSSGFRWLHDSFGTNLRMTEMQAAIGRKQLKKMSLWNDLRSKNAIAIMNSCLKFPSLFRVPSSSKFNNHAWYRCYIFINNAELATDWSRDKIINEINNKGVPCFSGSCSEVYLEKAFEKKAFKPKKRLESAKDLGDTSIAFPVHPTLQSSEIEFICSVIEEIATLAQK